MVYKRTASDWILDSIVFTVVIFSMIITVYPFIYTLSMSISNPLYAASNMVFLWPRGFSIEAFRMIFDDAEIWRHYYNTLWYTGVGTTINVIVTVISAYPLSRKRFFLRRHLMKFIALTMFFSGGLVPMFILINSLGMFNTRWAIVVPAAISTFNLIICRSFFESIEDSLEDAARIDGASQFKILFRIFIPISKPIVAVLVLFYAVAHWNSFFPALLFLHDRALHPLQIYLRNVLVLATQAAVGDVGIGGLARSLAVLQLRYAVVIVTILPIICVYPFLQKYFVKGVMIGAVKG